MLESEARHGLLAAASRTNMPPKDLTYATGRGGNSIGKFAKKCI